MPLLRWERVAPDDANYQACMVVAMQDRIAASAMPVAGAAAGYAGGAIWGLALGYLACPYLGQALRRKIESGAALTDDEVRCAADAMGRYVDLKEAVDVVRLVGLIRRAGRPPGAARVCRNPTLTARLLLATS